MPDFNTIAEEIRQHASSQSFSEVVVRKKYLEHLHKITNRNVVLYYSAFLEKSGNIPLRIDDSDMGGFMLVLAELPTDQGLDLILHTPGGILSSAEAIIRYIRDLFGDNIRVIVPQLAMSAGTLIALSAKEIIMGAHSSLGPIDPQFMGVSAHAVIEEFDNAKEEIKKDPSCIELWKTIIAKYRPTLIGDCQKAVAWSAELARELLSTGMFRDSSEESKLETINHILAGLADHGASKSHDRHFSATQCKDFGLKIANLGSDQNLQDAVLSIHHAAICTMGLPSVVKLIENHKGKRYLLETQVPTKF
jgi:ATP-dependent protease ClpP protease subunit